MRTVFYFLCILIFCTACQKQRQDKKLTFYANEISAYDCDALRVEERFADNMLQELQTAKDTYNPTEDVVLNLMTLGTDTLVDGSSPYTKANYSRRIALIESKKQLIQERYHAQCTS